MNTQAQAVEVRCPDQRHFGRPATEEVGQTMPGTRRFVGHDQSLAVSQHSCDRDLPLGWPIGTQYEHAPPDSVQEPGPQPALPRAAGHLRRPQVGRQQDPVPRAGYGFEPHQRFLRYTRHHETA